MDNIVIDPSQDWERLFNMRTWLEKAVEAKGATVEGGGCGCGGADIDIKLEGYLYNISIRPIVKEKSKDG